MKVTYISHSGFFIELEKTALLFDYWKGTLPEIDKKLYVFASHSHGDHFNPDIFKLREGGSTAFILSDDIRLRDKRADTVFVKANKSYDIEGIKVETLKSTDEGVAFIVLAEGRSIYHAGDLNLWVWEGESKAYNNNMRANFRRYTEPLMGRSFDAGFIPLDPRQEKDSFSGLDEYLKLAEFKAVFPMHFWGKYDIIERYRTERGASADNVKVIERENQEFLL